MGIRSRFALTGRTRERSFAKTVFKVAEKRLLEKSPERYAEAENLCSFAVHFRDTASNCATT